MKRERRGIILLSLVLFANLVVTQQVVNEFFFQHYRNVLIYAVINLALFPLAIWIYRKQRNI